MLNKCFLQGRLTRDPKLRHTQSGTPVASFSLAVDRDFKDKSTGERQTDFIDCVAWRNTAEHISRYFSKGRMAVVVGQLQMRGWTDKDGNKRRSAEVVVESIYFGDSKRDSAGDSAPSSSYGGYGTSSTPDAAYAPPTGGDQFAELSDDDGELPF